MKCPKCNYTSFDYNQVCPKCGNDNAEEQTRLKLSPNKPNPPFFLASLVGMTNSENLKIPGRVAGMGASESASGGMDAQDLLIALDDLDADDAKPDSPEPLDPSKDEIVFETDDPKEDSLEPLDPAEDEILFDLEPATNSAKVANATTAGSEKIEIESLDSDPLDKKSFLDVDGPDEKQIAVDVAKMPSEKQAVFTEEMPEEAYEVDLFLADEPGSAEIPTEKTGSSKITHTPEEADSAKVANATTAGSNSPELFLSLDDLPDSDTKTEPSASSSVEGDEILFELEETSETESAPDEKGFWNSDEINEQLAAFELEEATTEKKDPSPKDKADGKKDVNLFSDMDIEPLDLELSLDDMKKKSE
jgi:hypothetical protein